VQDQVVQDGAQVAQDEPLAILSPGEQQVWEALRGLYFVGGAADLEAIEPYAGRAPGMSDRIRQQAAATAQAIRSRTGN
ncbi:MAG TPA: hypothetical protein VN648_21175, partial [Candidatus Methylomirabilis sp.]|nr:hypothetical protein [Candidatus Methylomirabilis sp.]